MAQDPMRMLRTVRLLSVEQARHALAACLDAEAAAADRLRAIHEAAKRDRAASRSIIQGHLFVDMFVRRAQVGTTDRHAAEADLSAAQHASAAARATLVAARTAAEAVETLIDERADAFMVDSRRREQHALDDMARSRSVTATR